ncbi:MAG: tetratricopeptide repeat protein [Candidatus Brocadiales bacterium]|nr:tetratricopeptide repeat protein [Candidatus Brocadiales bacterium]
MSKTGSVRRLFTVFTSFIILCPIIISLLLLPSAGHAGIFDKEKKPGEIAKKYGAAVVFITSFDKESKALGAGNGFIIDPNGIVVTNYHYINGAATAWVKLMDGAHYQVEGILGADRDRDVVVLKVKAKNLPSTPIGDSDELSWGERIVVLDENTVSEGLILALMGHEGAMQFTSQIPLSSSGGPIFNTKGQVAGVVTSLDKKGQNLNFAAPINIVKPLLNGKLVALAEAAKETEGKPDSVISQFQEAVRLRPDDAETHYNLGVAYSEEDLNDLAINEFQEALRLKPDYAEAHLGLGIEYGLKGMYDMEVNKLQEAVRLRPDFAKAHFFLGLAYGEKGQYDLAINELQEAVRLSPDFAEAHASLGAVYSIKGQYDLAVNELQEALRLKPDYAVAHFGLSSVYHKQGQYDLVVNELQEALKLDPD